MSVLRLATYNSFEKIFFLHKRNLRRLVVSWRERRILLWTGSLLFLCIRTSVLCFAIACDELIARAELHFLWPVNNIKSPNSCTQRMFSREKETAVYCWLSSLGKQIHNTHKHHFAWDYLHVGIEFELNDNGITTAFDTLFPDSITVF